MPPASPCGPQRPLAHLGIEPPLWSCGHSQTAWLGLSPSWHRRQRRQRATARVYLRAHFAPFSPRSVAAATCIARHHGSTRPRTAAQPEDNWSIGGSMTWVCCLCAASNRSRLVCWRCGSTEEGLVKVGMLKPTQIWGWGTDHRISRGCHLTLTLVVRVYRATPCAVRPYSLLGLQGFCNQKAYDFHFSPLVGAMGKGKLLVTVAHMGRAAVQAGPLHGSSSSSALEPQPRNNAQWPRKVCTIVPVWLPTTGW